MNIRNKIWKGSVLSMGSINSGRPWFSALSQRRVIETVSVSNNMVAKSSPLIPL